MITAMRSQKPSLPSKKDLETILDSSLTVSKTNSKERSSIMASTRNLKSLAPLRTSMMTMTMRMKKILALRANFPG